VWEMGWHSDDAYDQVQREDDQRAFASLPLSRKLSIWLWQGVVLLMLTSCAGSLIYVAFRK